MPDKPLPVFAIDEEDDERTDEWIITFADLATLLLVFFILLFSMSVIDLQRFADSFTSVREVFGGTKDSLLTSNVRSDDAVLLETVRLQKQLLEAQRKVFSDVRTFLNRKGLEGVVGAVFDEGVVTVKIPAALLFEKDKVELSENGTVLLQEMTDLFVKKKDQSINIRGYTDDSGPLPGSRFKDNWEVSALQAVSVLRFLLKFGIEPERLTATGLGSLGPLFPNSSEDNRAKNRRVEFSLERRVGS